MKSRPLIGLLLFTLLNAVLGFGRIGAAAEAAPATNDARYILFLTADGFRTDYVEWYNPPNIKQLIAEGVRIIHATNVFPTVTAPNMTSLVTGSYPRTTTIAGNTEYLGEDDKIIQHPRHDKAETIAETLQKAGWRTASVNHFMLENRGAAIYEAPGYDDSEKTTAAILELLRQKDVHFIAAIYGATDHAGHSHGPHSDEVKAAVLGIDQGVGQLVKALKDAGLYDKTLIVFSADHGMSEYESKGVSPTPAKALQQAGFKVATSAEQLKADTQVVIISAGVQMIYFRKNMSAEQKQKATEALSKIEGAEVLDRKQLDALNCHDNHSGDLIVSPLPGYTMSNAGKPGGQHGRFPEQNPILFFHGPGFTHGTVDAAHTVDIVPTLLNLVHVEPAKTVDGKVINAALEH